MFCLYFFHIKKQTWQFDRGKKVKILNQKCFNALFFWRAYHCTGLSASHECSFINAAQKGRLWLAVQRRLPIRGLLYCIQTVYHEKKSKLHWHICTVNLITKILCNSNHLSAKKRRSRWQSYGNDERRKGEKENHPSPTDQIFQL